MFVWVDIILDFVVFVVVVAFSVWAGWFGFGVWRWRLRIWYFGLFWAFCLFLDVLTYFGYFLLLGDLFCFGFYAYFVGFRFALVFCVSLVLSVFCAFGCFDAFRVALAVSGLVIFGLFGGCGCFLGWYLFA